jgi:hypothetical protein
MTDTTPVTPPTPDQEKQKELEKLANEADVIIIPKPRFYTLLGSFVLAFLLLWNQTNLWHLYNYTADGFCSTHQAQLTLPVPVPVTPPAPIVVPTTPTQAPDELAKVRDVRRFYLASNQVDGKIVLRTGGTIPWRFNNPGKLKQNDFAKQLGSIGSDGTFAIFPSYDIGRKALKAYLFTGAGDTSSKSLKEVFPDDTLKIIVHETGLDENVPLKDYSDVQQTVLMDEIQKVNVFLKGKVTLFNDENDFAKNGW